jgi:hypothetical protein
VILKKILIPLVLLMLAASAAAISVTVSWSGNGESGSFTREFDVPDGASYSESWTILPGGFDANRIIEVKLPNLTISSHLFNNSTRLSNISARLGNSSPAFYFFVPQLPEV